MNHRSFGQSTPDLSKFDITKTNAQLLIVSGVIGGLFLGYQAARHMFVEGLTPKERKHMLMFSGVTLGIWAAGKFYDIDKLWFLTPEGVLKRIEQAATEP